MHNDSGESTALEPLAARLASRQDTILARWRTAVGAADANILVGLTREDFYDHIPDFLDHFNHSLRSGHSDLHAPAISHGAHRWQQGLDFEEVMPEWGILHEVMLDQIATEADPLKLPTATLMRTLHLLADAIGRGLADSLGEFNARQRLEASVRVRDLESVLEERGERESQRGRGLHQAAHDLRGSLQAIMAASHLLKTRAADEDTRNLAELLGGAVDGLSQMFADLRDLARLEAGRESRKLADFDAGELLNELCRELAPLAAAEDLALDAEGPESLAVCGDEVNVRRIAQNLILNALKYTAAGRVQIAWRARSPGRWSFEVSDTGVGLSQSTAAALTVSLKDAEHDAQQNAVDIDAAAGSGEEPSARTGAVAAHGEGIGLLIVHQLCKLLDGLLEVHSTPRGTTFRVVLPTDYPDT